jgi:RHS repeat-associated protein
MAIIIFSYEKKINVPDYIIKGGEKYKVLTDHLGSVRYVVRTSDGGIVEEIEYDSFGNVLYDLNPGFVPFGFTGGLYDPDTKLVRFGARDYDPEIGRWTSKDAVLFYGGDSNLYAYILNDPINLSDALGLKSVSFELWLGWGGKITIGKNPEGGFFATLKLGVGAGAGFSYDPYGTSPGYKYPVSASVYGSENLCWNFYDYYGFWNIYAGLSGEVSASALIGLDAGYRMGAYSSYDPSHETINKFNSETFASPFFEPTLKAKVGASFGIEISFFFGPL